MPNDITLRFKYYDQQDALSKVTVSAGKLKEWSLVLYGTSMHPYSLRSDKPRSTESQTPSEEDVTEDYNGE